jgi:hypothetical protein
MEMQFVLVLLAILSVLGEGPAQVGDRFTMHAINADSRFEAAAAFDVNHDGPLDIFCGDSWYEAPSWTRHKVREVKEVDEYYLDFADCPLDVNGDGWTDVVSVAWHDELVRWIENPGKKGGRWVEHPVARPGHMETALLVDLDGDGDQDLLPDIAERVCWFEFEPGATTRPAGTAVAGERPIPAEPPFRAHNLGANGNRHGIGFGDVNGDKRTDIICRNGWWEAPPKPADEPWTWHGEYDIGKPGIPILAFDVDGDRDTDLVYGQAHDYGVAWLEQYRGFDGARKWTRHEIDDSWSQAHCFFAIDVDLDGQTDVVTGKRFRAHNGHDPGADEPLGIYWYAYDQRRARWTRRAISQGGHAGLGSGASAADIDGDGDIDIIASGKGGLYLFVNQTRGAKPTEAE